MSIASGIEVVVEPASEHAWVLDPDALAFVAELQRGFGPRRAQLLQARTERAERLAAGEGPAFLPETAEIRAAEWRVAPVPAALEDRRCEITGPAEPKMAINALNSGARMFMADLEDALSPSWANVVQGQATLHAAHRRALEFTSPEGKEYRLNEQIATLLVRPRGWHLEERHVLVDGAPVSASLLDFGLHVWWNARETLARGAGPYYYLPKLESHLEARLWNDVFVAAQDRVGVPQGSIRATVLIETILAAFEMEEILYELRDHAAGLNAGRWDYIFSVIKKLGLRDGATLPDRAQVTMGVPFMRAYAQQLVRACHRHGAHAIGGMAAFIPSRRDAEVNRVALEKVREDKEREVGDGFDGTWVAHPDLVSVATAIFDRVLGDRPHQKTVLREDVAVDAASLVDLAIPGGRITEGGVRNNVAVGIQYVAAWLDGLGAVAIYNLMEDAATAEISRAQLWQWIHCGATLDDGRALTTELYTTIRDEELAGLGGAGQGRLGEAAGLLDELVLAPEFRDFLTIPAYARLS